MGTSVYHVAGTTCGHCVDKVSGAISRVNGIDEVTVDLDSGHVTVRAENPSPTNASGLQSMTPDTG